MVSVCIASFNGEKFIRQQLESILLQLSEFDEIVVSDDGSKDRTIDIILSMCDKRIKLFYNEGRRGYTSNFENALKHCIGDIIILSDQDDIWVKGKVKIICDHMKTYDFVTSDAMVVDQDLNVINKSLWSMRPPKFSPINDFIQCAYLGCCMAFSRKVLDFALPFPPNHRLCAHDYWLQLVGAFYFKVKYEHTPLVLYRRHGANVSDAGLSKGLPFKEKLEYRFYTLFWLIRRYYEKKKIFIF